MSDETKDSAAEPSEPRAPKVIEGGDGLLAALVLNANQINIGFPITLFVNGMVVTGMLASSRRYFEQLEDTLKQFYSSLPGLNQETIDGAAGQFIGSKDLWIDEKVPETIGFIHVVDARFYQSGQPIAKAGTAWRGKLSSVDGFIFGRLSVEQT